MSTLLAALATVAISVGSMKFNLTLAKVLRGLALKMQIWLDGVSADRASRLTRGQAAKIGSTDATTSGLTEFYERGVREIRSRRR